MCSFINSHTPFKILTELQDDSFETLWLYARPHKLPRGYSCLIVCTVYHPPQNDNKGLVDHLTINLDLALTKYPNAEIFLVGDFNRCPVSQLLRHFTLKQIVREATRNNVILDLILTNMATFCDPPLVTSPAGQSDHNSLICTFKKSQAKNMTTKVKRRKRNPTNRSAFGKWLADINWTTLYREVSCEQKMAIFQNVLKTGLDLFFPLRTVKLHDKDKPWVTHEFKKIILNRQKAYHDGKIEQYHYLRNLSHRQCAKLRSAYLRKMTDQLKSNPNPKKWCECIIQLAGYPKKKVFSSLVWDDEIINGEVLANKINDAFTTTTQEMSP